MGLIFPKGVFVCADRQKGRWSICLVGIQGLVNGVVPRGRAVFLDFDANRDQFLLVAENQSLAGLKTIEAGVVPECRMQNATAVQDRLRRLLQSDDKRSRKRALVDGLVDGNCPYSWRKLREAGRADACNVNWQTARAYYESSSGAYYDLSSQAPGFVQITTDHGNAEQRVDYSRIMSEEADLLFFNDEDWDNDIQLSQNEMTLHSTGPLWFEDAFKVFPMAVETGDLLVPPRQRSKLSRWEEGYICWDYYPGELYDCIRDEQAATTAGWNVAFTKLVIQNAMDIRQDDNTRTNNWERYQNELKSNNYTYADETKVCKVAHAYWREFSGRVTHAIIERESNAPATAENVPGESKQEGGTKYLFISVGRYASFAEAIHPMYADRGRGGYHHNVNGIGTGMYSALEYQNRLFSNLMDKTFAPKMLFKPTSTEAATKFQLARFGDYGVVPFGTEVLQVPIQGFLTDGLAMHRTSSDLMRSNLSSSRQTVDSEKPGNPATAYERRQKDSEAGSLTATTYARYYRQLDALYHEIIRRMFNLNTIDPRAKEVQARCVKRGVPKECFGRIERVLAVRAVGSGSPFLRRETLMSLGELASGFPEDGQYNWKSDVVAASCGQNAVQRYLPRGKQSDLATDQQFQAMTAVNMAHGGMIPPVTGSQNPLIFAGIFLKAATDAFNSLKQGGDPHHVLAFAQIAGKVIAAHLHRMGKDPLRRAVVKPLMEQMKRLGAMTDKLAKMLQQQAEKQKQLQQQRQQMLSDQSIKAEKTKGDLILKSQKQRAALAMQLQKHRQQLAISDAQSASQIHNSNRLAAFKE